VGKGASQSCFLAENRYKCANSLPLVASDQEPRRRVPVKLVIQIPCYNEEGTLAIALGCLPRTVPGFDQVEWLVIDDGSADGTVRVASENGVDHIVRHRRNQGLAVAFMTGLEASLAAGADVILNTDADNQYNAEDIPALVAPIIKGSADLVIGARPIESIQHFSKIKRTLQGLGSWVVRVASQTNVADAPSGFRAMTAKAAREMNVFTEYTYTIETIIQAGQNRMAIVNVPIRVNGDLRPSRLVKSISSYVRRSILVIGRIFLVYKPFAAFTFLGGICFLPGLLLGLRFMYFFMRNEGDGHVQSVILAALLMGAGLFLFVVGFVADLISVNRKLLEKVNIRLQNLEHRAAEREGVVPALRSGSHWHTLHRNQVSLELPIDRATERLAN
jgi:glycosyltransferase involved in cell wall biosynthesis